MAEIKKPATFERKKPLCLTCKRGPEPGGVEITDANRDVYTTFYPSNTSKCLECIKERNRKREQSGVPGFRENATAPSDVITARVFA